MVNATANPKLWRIEFWIEHSATSKSSVVCFLYVTEAGIRIYYSHNLVYSRPVEKGVWDQPRLTRLSLNVALKAVIEAGVFQEVWSHSRSGDVRTFPAEPEAQVEGVELE